MNSERLDLVIVDDSDVIVKRLRTILADVERVNCVGTATNYDEAINMVKALHPKVVLLDINLGGKNGIEVLREIKTNYKSTIVIMLTNFSGSYYRDTCKQLGAEYFLDKSSEFENIPEILKAL